MTNSTKQNNNNNVVFDSAPLAALLENMTSSTRPEVHNTLHCRHRRTEPWPQLTYAENFVKFGNVVYKIREGTDHKTYRHTDTLIAIHCIPTGAN